MRKLQESDRISPKAATQTADKNLLILQQQIF
jgi:hypothetical protein